MQISGIQSPYSDVTSQSTKSSQNGASFNDYLLGAGEDGVKQFMDYMKETPAQRMFTNFLESHHISQSQYDAMSPQQQKALKQEFGEQLKQQLEQQMKQQMAAASNPGASLDLK